MAKKQMFLKATKVMKLRRAMITNALKGGTRHIEEDGCSCSVMDSLKFVKNFTLRFPNLVF